MPNHYCQCGIVILSDLNFDYHAFAAQVSFLITDYWLSMFCMCDGNLLFCVNKYKL